MYRIKDLPFYVFPSIEHTQRFEKSTMHRSFRLQWKLVFTSHLNSGQPYCMATTNTNHTCSPLLIRYLLNISMFLKFSVFNDLYVCIFFFIDTVKLAIDLLYFLNSEFSITFLCIVFLWFRFCVIIITIFIPFFFSISKNSFKLPLRLLRASRSWLSLYNVQTIHTICKIWGTIWTNYQPSTLALMLF